MDGHTQIQRRCPANTLGRHVGLCVSTTCTVTQDLIQRLHSIVNSPSFPSSSVVPNFVKPINRNTSQVTSKQKNTPPLSHVFHPQSEALCLYVLTLSQHQNISKTYILCLLKNFRQRQNKISATVYILLLCWRIIDNTKTRHQEQHIAYCFVKEEETRESKE